SSRRRHTSFSRDWSSDVCSSDLVLEPEVRNRFASGSIDSSLFVAAQNAGLSHNLTMQMANVFGYDVDFAREIRQGDRFEVLFEEIGRASCRGGGADLVGGESGDR